ncbi:MAG: DinB family protein [Blastocatellia bacterium]
MKLNTLKLLFATVILCLVSVVSALAQGGAKPAAPAMANMDQSAMMVADWTRARDYTKEYLDAMPEDGLGFKPAPDIRSFAEQMLHLAAANYCFASAATGAANPMAGKNLETMNDLKTKAALTKTVMDSYDYVIGQVKAFDFAKSAEPIKLFGRVDTTRGVAFAKGFEHQTHHRGQTTIYLRLKGVKPPPEKLF